MEKAGKPHLAGSPVLDVAGMERGAFRLIVDDTGCVQVISSGVARPGVPVGVIRKDRHGYAGKIHGWGMQKMRDDDPAFLARVLLECLVAVNGEQDERAGSAPVAGQVDDVRRRLEASRSSFLPTVPPESLGQPVDIAVLMERAIRTATESGHSRHRVSPEIARRIDAMGDRIAAFDDEVGRWQNMLSAWARDPEAYGPSADDTARYQEYFSLLRAALRAHPQAACCAAEREREAAS